MLGGSSLDNLVRSTVQAEVQGQEPSASVRETLLAEAAAVRSRSAMGPSIPPLVNGLREPGTDQAAAPARLPVFSGQVVAERWLMMIAPVYAIR